MTMSGWIIGAMMLLTAVLSTSSEAASRHDKPTGFLFQHIEQGGHDYLYSVFVPRDYDASRKWPLIVFLNGAGECGTDGSKQIAVGLAPAIMTQPDKWKYIVLFPQKPDVKDAWEDHDAAVMAMVKRAQKDFNVDGDRLYLTGLSQGGHGTWAIGANHPDLWAAIAPICGYGKPEEIAPKLTSMPIWAFHGEADSVVPVKQSQDMVAAIEAKGGSAKLTTYPGVNHNSWDKAYREETLYDWFLTHRRGEKSSK